MNGQAMKRIFSVVILGFVLFPGCSRQGPPTRTVAIATLMNHPALDQVATGIKSELERRGWREGSNLRYLYRNANQQINLVPTIANDLAAQNPDVVVAITTPMAQAMRHAIKGPLVFAAVTDPVGAGLVSDTTRPEPLVTGSCDAWPYRDQLALIRQILPQAKTLGVLYNPGEAASQYGIQEIRKYAPEFSFSIVEGSVSSVNDVAPAAQNLVARVDALFLSSDNTVIGGATGAIKVAIVNHKALFAGDSGTVRSGALASVSVGYEQLGIETGRLVDRVLRGEKNIPVVIARGSDVYINRKSAEMMRVTIPQSVLEHATKVYDDIQQ